MVKNALKYNFNALLLHRNAIKFAISLHSYLQAGKAKSLCKAIKVKLIYKICAETQKI